jgi:hypothetical protein
LNIKADTATPEGLKPLLLLLAWSLPLCLLSDFSNDVAASDWQYRFHCRNHNRYFVKIIC